MANQNQMHSTTENKNTIQYNSKQQEPNARVVTSNQMQRQNTIWKKGGVATGAGA